MGGRHQPAGYATKFGWLQLSVDGQVNLKIYKTLTTISYRTGYWMDYSKKSPSVHWVKLLHKWIFTIIPIKLSIQL